MSDYNYADFVMDREMPNFGRFSGHLHVGERAPDFPLEHLATGETVQLKALWAREMVIMEFGSFT